MLSLDRSLVLNSCIEVSDYNEPYSLCQPLLPSPQSTLGLTRAKPSGILPPLQGGPPILVAEEGVVVKEVDLSHLLKADRILFRTLFAVVTLRVYMLRVVEAHKEDVNLDNDGLVKRRE